jgi:hypothetical protein
MRRFTSPSLIVAGVLLVSSFGTVAMGAEGKLKAGDPVLPYMGPEDRGEYNRLG